jgi:hypothetical protein
MKRLIVIACFTVVLLAAPAISAVRPSLQISPASAGQPFTISGCGYKLGHSEINRQRDNAKAALGPKYDLKAFDDTVVRGGDVPLDVLAKNVDEYVGRRPAR